MNKRIQELAYQAGLDTSTPAFSHMSFQERFAELILADIDKVSLELYHALPLHQAAVLLTLDENIKEHFYGIE